MSETKGDKKPTAAVSEQTAAPTPDASALPDLMAAGQKSAQAPASKPAAKAPAKPAPKAAPDLEAEALRAAEAAITEGKKALSAANTELRGAPQPARQKRGREFALGALLAVNVLAMLVVAILPTPEPVGTPASVTHEMPAVPHAPSSASQARFNEPWNRALAAAERRDFREATTILDAYLAAQPRMAPSQQLSVLMALAHYSARNNDFKQAQEYQRRADAIEHSHSLPDDLVAMAKAAAESGDQESLRRIWARFLLQQRQIPSWLYKHVAEAYLQLGDSYRQQANTAEEQVRLQQLEEAAVRLREQDKGAGGGK